MGEIKDPRALEPLTAAKDSDKDIREYAAGALGDIHDPQAVEFLLGALNKPDFAVIAGAYPFFILRGERRSEHAVIQALNARGSVAMAECFLNCGNSVLEAAAREWARTHGHQVTSLSGVPPLR